VTRTKELKAEYPKGCAPPAGYVAWHEWAEAQGAHGLTQKQCERCWKYYFPQEKPSHMTCEQIKRPAWASSPDSGLGKHE